MFLLGGLVVGAVAVDAQVVAEAYVVEKAAVPDGVFAAAKSAQLVVPDERWGPFASQVLRVDFGKGELSLELRCPAGQAAVTGFPLVLGKGLKQAGFNPGDGQLYLAGGGSGGQRVRFTGAVPRMPVALKAVAAGVEIQFACTLDTQLAREPASWRLVADGGKTLAVASIDIGTDDRTVFLNIPNFGPPKNLTIRYALKSSDDRELRGEIVAKIDALSAE